MLPTSERLKSSREIERVLKKGNRTSSPLFSVFYLKSSQSFRGAVITGLKVSKKATERNKVKRRFLASLREIRQNNILTGDFVFILRKAIFDTEFTNIKGELERCLRKLL